MKKLKIKHHFTTPYHPQVCTVNCEYNVFYNFVQANGLDERFNQTLQKMIVKFCHSNKSTWDDYLDSCTFAYNISRYFSLYMLLHFMYAM